MDRKNIIIGIIGIIAVIGLFAGLHKSTVITTVTPPPPSLGSVVGPTDPSPFKINAGVFTYFLQQDMLAGGGATDTVCMFTTPAGTTTLQRLTATLPNATTSGTQELTAFSYYGKGGTGGTTTIASNRVALGSPIVLSASSTARTNTTGIGSILGPLSNIFVRTNGTSTGPANPGGLYGNCDVILAGVDKY